MTPLLTALRVSISFLAMALIVSGLCLGLAVLAYLFS